MAGGFLSRRCKKKTPSTCRFTHERVSAKPGKHLLHTFTFVGTNPCSSQRQKNQKGTQRCSAFPDCTQGCACSPYKTLPAPNPSPQPHGSGPALFPGLLGSPARAQHPPTGQRVLREHSLTKPRQEWQYPLCIMSLGSCQIPLHPLPLLNVSIISWQPKPQRVERQLQAVQSLSLKGKNTC